MIPLLFSLAASAASPVLSELSFDLSDEERDFAHRFEHTGPVHVDVGATLDAGVLRVDFDKATADRVTVLYRYETSISLSLEGPHWDLTDFVHGDSGWQRLTAAPDGGFPLPPMPAEALVFPDVSADEIEQAVRAYLGEYGREAEDVPRCESATSMPCRVDLSRVWLHVSAWKDGAVAESHVVELIIPMGC